MRFGYSKNVPHKQIIETCKSVENKLKKHCVNRSSICSKILMSIGFKLKDFKMGKDTIGFRANSFHLLENFFADCNSYHSIKEVEKKDSGIMDSSISQQRNITE